MGKKMTAEEKAVRKAERWRNKFYREKETSHRYYWLVNEGIMALEMLKDHQFRKIDMEKLDITAWQEIEMLRDFAGRKARTLREKL